ncbi:heme ABC transporter substrate-binding protein IsdE [Ruminococcus flavefaciens]|uniref:heme ABC transporter substrate-binding protein IsdE n=1 Tax=Ruminococcus flavefaciens TaxID=1265 RepID=UPI00048BFCC5|nr:heme ABC transporter substrate-binding protein IsdE [Ruminococcus flavefaciens]
MKIRKIAALGLSLVISGAMSGCVDQHPDSAKEVNTAENVRLVATSPATADIMDRLDLDLVGVSDTSLSTIPERYDDVERIGIAMSPDTEKIATLDADWILGPASLKNDLQPKYSAIGVKSIFVNLESVEGMYQSIDELGKMFDREKQAKAMIDEYNEFIDEYHKKNEGKEQPKVLVLMGFPGSFSVATENSYTGSLVRLAGGKNVYEGEDKDYIVANTEDIIKKDPDVIVCTAHGGLDEVAYKYLKDDFKNNDIWQHFRAVEEDNVYYLDSKLFSMSANFDYPEALDVLQPILYGEE